MRSATLDKSAFQWAWLCLLVAACAVINPAPAAALVVQDMTGTTVAPAGAGNDPGWNYVTGQGSRNYVYLGDGWALSAFHVGLPDLESDSSDGPEDADSNDELIGFSNGSFVRIKNQAYQVKNPCFYTPAGCAASGTTEGTDLRLIRLNGVLEQPNGQPLPDITIASQEITELTQPQLSQRQVTIIGPGPTRWPAETQWAAAVVAGSNNDTWTESCGGDGQPACNQRGYKSAVPDDDVKRWGTNQIADEDTLFGGGDTNLRGTIRLSNRDIVSMVTQFDAPGVGSTALANETQTVAGDSGSAVFYKRAGNWELLGIVNAVFPPLSYDRSPGTTTAVYGSYTTFADLSFYRDEILRIMNDHPYDLVMGDVNLDGVVGGNGTGPVASDDVSAFVAGWSYDDESGTGSYTSWLKGDLSGDGKTDVADFFLLRSALNSSGSGAGLSLASLTGSGVPEPASLLMAMVGAAALACRRHPRRNRVVS